MANKQVVEMAGLRLFAGLEWRLLSSELSTSAALRATASSVPGNYAVVVTSPLPVSVQIGKRLRDVRPSGGGFLAAYDENEKKPDKKAHSLAAAFARWTRQHADALLSVRLPTGETALSVVLKGVPTLDVVYEREGEAYTEALRYMKLNPTISIFSDDAVKFPSSLMEHGLLEAIAAAADKSTAIKPIPVNVAKVATLAVMLAGALVGYFKYQDIEAEKARLQLVERARNADPVPKYLQALAERRGVVGAKPSSLVQAVQAASRAPTRLDGWELQRVGCMFPGTCLATYKRGSGTYTELASTVGFMTLNQGDSMNLNEGQMTWQQPMEPAPMPEPRETQPAFIEGKAGSTFQNWMVAGLGVQLQKPSLWPEVPGVPAAFKHELATAMGNVEITGIPLPVLQEVLTAAPSNVVWRAFSIELGEAKAEPLERAKAKVTGTYYVKN